MTDHICILVYNRPETEIACLETVLPTLDPDSATLTIIDNASATDETRRWFNGFSRRPKRSIFARLDRNLGVSGARGLWLHSFTHRQYADTDTLVFLDSDVTAVTGAWLGQLKAGLEPENVGMVGPGGSFVLPDWSGFTAGRLGAVDCVAGYCQAFKALFIPHTAIDTEYGIFWTEDSDFCLQIRELGYDVMCLPVDVLHTPAHSGDAPGLHAANVARFKAKWQGKGLTKHEGGY